MLPVVVIHNAVSVDGRTDWFTPDIEKFYELTNAWNEDATLAGSDTLLAAYGEAAEENSGDDPVAEEPRDPDDSRPLLVVPDSRGRLRIWQMLKKEESLHASSSTDSERKDHMHMRYAGIRF